MILDSQWLTIRAVQVTIIIACSLLPGLLCATELLTIKVNDQNDNLVENAVISAFAQTKPSSPAVSANKTRVIDQIDKEFIRHVTVIQKGSQIDFPNHDQIHHHVYSFSQAKPFEIPLYKGLYKSPILFEKTGVISLGCNIHDWMSAYIYITDTSYFSISNKKGLALLDLPPGIYDIRYWHPDIDENNQQMSKTIKISAGSSQALSVQLNLKKAWALRRGPLSSFNRGQYR